VGTSSREGYGLKVVVEEKVAKSIRSRLERALVAAE
jgi:hypothetical protein